MTKKELEQKVSELEKKNGELVDALVRMPMYIQQMPCTLQHYPSQIYPQPWYPTYPIISALQCQAQIMLSGIQNDMASQTYNVA